MGALALSFNSSSYAVSKAGRESIMACGFGKWEHSEKVSNFIVIKEGGLVARSSRLSTGPMIYYEKPIAKD